MSIKSYEIHVFLVMLVLFSLIFSFLKVQNLFTSTIGLVSTCFIPGFLLLKTLQSRLEFYELLPTSVVLSMVIMVLLGFCLSTTPLHLSPMSLLSSILLFTMILELFSIFHKREKRADSKPIKERCRDFLKILREERTLVILMILITLIPVLFLDDVLRYQYYLGYDPYRNESLISSIIQNKLDPSSFLNHEKIVFSGFYYFTAALHVSTGISIHSFTRFGGLALFSLLTLMIFVATYRIFKDKWAAIIPFFFAINPFVANRFVMAIRENISFLFLALLIFFLLKLDKNTKKSITIVSAMTFGATLSTSPIAFIFASVLIFFFVLTERDLRTYSLLILGGCLFVFPMLRIFASWFNWVVIAQFQIFLGCSRILTPSWLSEQQILFSWSRDVFFEDFSILEIALLPLGIFYTIKKGYIMKTKKLNVIIPLCLQALTFYLFAKLGFHFTPVRLVIYMALPLAILSGLGLKEAITKVSGYMPTFVVITSTRRKTLAPEMGKKVFMTAIITPIIFFGSISTISSNKWCPYISSQVEAARWLKQYLGNGTDTIVIPSVNDMGLTDYVGIENAIYWENRTLVENMMSATSFEELKELIHINYPDKDEAYFFISQRWIKTYETEYSFTILNVLESMEVIGGCVEEIYDQDVLIFKIYLDRSVIIIKDDDGEIDKWIGISFNDRKAMKTLFLEKNLNIRSVNLSIYMKKRDFDGSGAYEGNWSLIINGHNHTYSWDDISEAGDWVKKEIPTSEIFEDENQIVILKQSPDHIFVGLDTDNDFNHSAFYCEGKWDNEKLGKWYGTFDGEYMIRLVMTISV